MEVNDKLENIVAKNQSSIDYYLAIMAQNFERGPEFVKEGDSYTMKNSKYNKSLAWDCFEIIMENNGFDTKHPMFFAAVNFANTDSSKVWQDFKKYLDELFEKKLTSLREEQKEKALNTCSDLIEKFLIIAEKKVSNLDEYSEEAWEALPVEVEVCTKKIINKNTGLTQLDKEWIVNKLTERFKLFHKNHSDLKTLLNN